MNHTVSLSKTGRRVKIILLCACIVLAFISLGIAWKFTRTNNTIYHNAQDKAVTITQKTASGISHIIGELRIFVDTFAHDLSSGKIPIKNIIERIQQKPSNMNGLGIAFAPYAYDSTKKLYAPYFVQHNDTSQLIALEHLVDYSNPDNPRFSKAMQQGPILHNPFFDEISKTMIVEYTVPFYDHNKKIMGIVFGNYTVQYLQHIIESLYPSRYGYESIIADDGTYVLHPNYTFVEQKRTAPHVARQINDIILAENMEKAIKGELRFFTYKNLVSSQNSWMFFEPIPLTPWYASGTFVIDDLVVPTQESDIEFILLVIALTFFVIILLLYSIKIYINPQKKLRLASAIVSAGMLIIVVSVWYKEWMYTGKETTEILEKNINFETLIQKFYAVEDPKSPTMQEQSSQKIVIPTLVYTGLYIHKLSIDIDSVSFIGYIWQKYPLSALEKITPVLVVIEPCPNCPE